MSSLKDKFRGCIVGGAVGDALGFPLEFLSKEEIKRMYPDGVNSYIGYMSFPLGTYSDDTQMGLAVAQSLIEESESVEKYMNILGDNFIRWYHSQENNRAPGMTCKRSIKRYERTKDWRSSGDLESRGCGAAMRTSPIGLLFKDRPDKRRIFSDATAKITHSGSNARASALAVTNSISLALEEKCFEDIYELSVKSISEIDKKCEEHLKKVGDIVNRDISPEKIISITGEGWCGDEAVANAFYCVLSGNDFYGTMMNAMKLGGGTDIDSIACIAGAIAGANYGLNNIPKDWAERVENKDLLMSVADEIYLKYKHQS